MNVIPVKQQVTFLSYLYVPQIFVFFFHTLEFLVHLFGIRT